MDRIPSPFFFTHYHHYPIIPHALCRTAGNILPINPNASTFTNILILGDDVTVHGGGSGGVVTPYVITPYQVRSCS